MANYEASIAPKFDIMNFIRIDNYRDEAKEIAELYCKTYNITSLNALTQLSYPYPEALDPEWIHKKGSSRNVVWKVVTDMRNGAVVGSGTVMLNRENQRAYVRGVMIDPDYQKYRIGSKVLVNTFREIIQTYRDVIKIFWNESRTAHSGSQKIAEDSGFRPVGLLPNKDIFLEKRESDLLMVLYAMNALKTRRPDPQLIPEVLPIYNAIVKRFRLNPVTPIHLPKIVSNNVQVKGNIQMDKYLYGHCVYRADGEELSFKINPRTHVAEETCFSRDTDPKTLKTLVKMALDSLQPILYYLEFYVSAYDPPVQRVFADLGFQATGYIPGWEFVDGAREDRIIFSWVKESPALATMELTPRAREIVLAAMKEKVI